MSRKERKKNFLGNEQNRISPLIDRKREVVVNRSGLVVIVILWEGKYYEEIMWQKRTSRMKKVVFKTVVESAVKKYFQIAIQASGKSKTQQARI